MRKKWHIFQPDPSKLQQIVESCKCHPITATILAKRLDKPQDAWQYLSPSLDNIKSPFSIKDMDIAVNRIVDSIFHHQKIMVFGDYDADGITSLCILYEFLQYTGADVIYYIPHRIREGYGLKEQHIQEALQQNVRLIITVDNGTTSHNAAIMAKKSGVDLIITDHHEISEQLPDAFAVVNPKRPDCNAGFAYLAGVGVVFCMLICLRKVLRDANFWKDKPEPNLAEYCDLVAIGTIADIVPLINENRIFARKGLELLAKSKRIGIKALKEVCNLNDIVTSSDIAFKIAPRLNAAGRLEHASIGVEMLMTSDMNRAKQIAKQLDASNLQRRSIETNMLYEIQSYILKNTHLLEKRSIVLCKKGWHEGVIGIVASKLVGQYYRPVVLISVDNESGKGSGRSIPGFNLYDGLAACFGCLEVFGGHSMAAGLTIKQKNINPFRDAFESIVAQKTSPDDFLPKINVDYLLNFNQISEKLLDELSQLEPFGAENPEPVFAAQNVYVQSWKNLGNKSRKLILKQSDGRRLDAIHFDADTNREPPKIIENIAFKLQWNRWRGVKNIQLMVEELT